MPNRSTARNLAIALTAITAPTAWADGDANAARELEETVIVASRVPTPLNRLGVSVTVTNRQTLELLGYSDVGDFLDLTPGVSVTRDGGPGKAAAVRIRGEEGFRTRVVLDGIDIADPSSPQVSPRIEHLLSEGLERIEILRGPQGLAFGADAGGVIAMTTRQPTSGLEANLAVEGGEYGFSRLGAFVAGGSERVSGALSVTELGTDGFNARTFDSVDADRDGYDNTTVHASGRLSPAEHWLVEGSLHAIDGENEYDGCFDTVTFALINDCSDDYQQAAWRVGARYQKDRIGSTLSYERSKTERDFYSAGLPAFSSEGDREEISWIGSLTTRAGQRLTVGADASEVTVFDGEEDQSRDNLGLWGEYGLDLLLGSMTLGARFDDNDDFGQHTSWRISVQQQVIDAERPLVLKGAMGTGFRAPSPYEIAYNKTPYSFPASDSEPLREEQSEGWEIGLAWGTPETFVEATWFDQEVENQIYFYYDPGTFLSGYLQNVGTSRSRGVELLGEAALAAGFQLSANLTWNETRSASGDQRPYRPEWTGAASLVWQGSWLSAAVTARFTQASVDTLGQAMPDTERLDGSLRATLSKNLQLTARVENISNSRDAQIQGYNVMPRAMYLGLRYKI